MGDRHCRHAIEQMYFYLDGESTVIRKMRVQWHLRRCGKCTSAFSFERRFRQVIHDRSSSEAPPDLMAKMRRYLEENKDC